MFSPYQYGTLLQAYASVLQTKQDTIDTMEDILCDEYAMEFAFEGSRFSDLCRMARHRNTVAQEMAQWWIAAKLAQEIQKMDLTDERNWYFPYKIKMSAELLALCCLSVGLTFHAYNTSQRTGPYQSVDSLVGGCQKSVTCLDTFYPSIANTGIMRRLPCHTLSMMDCRNYTMIMPILILRHLKAQFWISGAYIEIRKKNA